MKILVADDSRTMRRVFRTLLESMGHAAADIIEAGDAIEALSVLKICKYDVDYIIADHDMVGMEGHKFLHRLKADCPQKTIPVVMCINASHRMVAAESLRHGATVLLERPFRDAEARQTLQTVEAGLKSKKADDASKLLKDIATSTEVELDLPFLMQLPSQTMKEFLQLSIRTTYEAGQIIFHAGNPVDSLYVVTLGDVEVAYQNGGKPEIIREGETFGEIAFMSGERSNGTAKAHSMSQVIALPRNRLTELVSRQPRMLQYLNALVARRTRQKARPQSPGNSEFSGKLTSMSFSDVLQLLQVGRKTGILQLDAGAGKGAISIQNGEVRHASVAGGASGEDAFYLLAGWRDATFSFTSRPLQDAPTIQTPTMSLLMEAMRRVDEADRSGGSSGEKTLKDLF